MWGMFKGAGERADRTVSKQERQKGRRKFVIWMSEKYEGKKKAREFGVAIGGKDSSLQTSTSCIGCKRECLRPSRGGKGC